MMAVCRSCLGNLEKVLDLGSIHLNEYRYDDVVPDSFPLSLDICTSCFLVQLGESVDPEIIYTDAYGFESGINNTVRADLAEIVSEAMEIVDVHRDTLVVDIGCNDGTLLSNYPPEVLRIGIDPVEKFVDKSEKRADHIISDFFSAKDIKHYTLRKAKIITSISMFYDLEDPNQFCQDINEILDDQGIWVVQQNYLLSMLKQNAYDNIVHQHVEYYSLHSMVNLLSRHGLRLFRVSQNNINGGSFRTFICKQNAHFETEQNVRDLFDEEKYQKLTDLQTYTEFGIRINELAHDLYYVVQTLVDDGKKIYAYGASTRGDTILQFSRLDRTLIPFAVERNESKFGKRISSLQIPIISEAQAREEKPDYMLVLPWFFIDEFLVREEEYLTNGGRFIVPLPKISIIGGNLGS